MKVVKSYSAWNRWGQIKVKVEVFGSECRSFKLSADDDVDFLKEKKLELWEDVLRNEREKVYLSTRLCPSLAMSTMVPLYQIANKVTCFSRQQSDLSDLSTTIWSFSVLATIH